MAHMDPSDTSGEHYDQGIPYGVKGKTPQNIDPTIDNWLRNLLGGEGGPLGVLPQSPTLAPTQGSLASGQQLGVRAEPLALSGPIPENINPHPVAAPPSSVLPPIPGIDLMDFPRVGTPGMGVQDVDLSRGGAPRTQTGTPMEPRPPELPASPPAFIGGEDQVTATQPTTTQQPTTQPTVPPTQATDAIAEASAPATTANVPEAPVESLLNYMSEGVGGYGKLGTRAAAGYALGLNKLFRRPGPDLDASQRAIREAQRDALGFVGDLKMGTSIYDFLEDFEWPQRTDIPSMKNLAEGEDFDPSTIGQSIPEQTSFTSPLGVAPPEQTSFTSPLVPEGVTTIEPEEGQSPIDALIEKLGLLEMGDNERVVAMEGIPISIRVELLERIEEILESANIGDNIQ